MAAQPASSRSRPTPTKRAAGLAATIASIKSEGVESARGVAKALNERGIVTARGGQWSARLCHIAVRRARSIGA
jgi:hypothetical protein